MEWKKYERISRELRVFSHPVRISIIRELIRCEECSVTELCNILELSQSTISQHLWRLKSCNIVMSRRSENVRIYWACHAQVKQITAILMRG
ncbi:hypothetical protein BTW32_30995 [Bacillus thuringiensis]|nr:hypothetical protein BTW32_30995 [Bacillus thuringiensis]